MIFQFYKLPHKKNNSRMKSVVLTMLYFLVPCYLVLPQSTWLSVPCSPHKTKSCSPVFRMYLSLVQESLSLNSYFFLQTQQDCDSAPLARWQWFPKLYFPFSGRDHHELLCPHCTQHTDCHYSTCHYELLLPCPDLHWENRYKTMDKQ